MHMLSLYKSQPYTMLKQWCVLIILLITLVPSLLFGQETRYEIYSGRPFDLMLKQTLDSYRAFATSSAEASFEIAKARKAYFDATKKGPVSPQVEEDYHQALLAKDLYFYTDYIMGRKIGGRQNQVSLDKLVGGTDGGIFPRCKEAFDNWVFHYANRYEELAEGKGWDIEALGKAQLQAFEETQDYYLSYQIIRDWVEFENQGVKWPGADEKKAFALAIMHGYSLPYGAKKVVEQYQEVIDLFGEVYVLEQYQRYRDQLVPNSSGYYLKNDHPFDKYHTKDPYDKVQSLIANGNGRNYILGKLFFSQGSKDWAKTKAIWNRLNYCFEPKKVEAYAMQVWSLPKLLNDNRNYELLREPVEIGSYSSDFPLSVFYFQLYSEDTEGLLKYRIATYEEHTSSEETEKALQKLYQQYGEAAALEATKLALDRMVKGKGQVTYENILIQLDPDRGNEIRIEFARRSFLEDCEKTYSENYDCDCLSDEYAGLVKEYANRRFGRATRSSGASRRGSRMGLSREGTTTQLQQWCEEGQLIRVIQSRGNTKRYTLYQGGQQADLPRGVVRACDELQQISGEKNQQSTVELIQIPPHNNIWLKVTTEGICRE